MVIVLSYVFASCRLQHLGCLSEKVFQKLFIVTVIIHFCHEQWNSVLIGLVFAEVYSVCFFWNSLSLHVHVNTPLTRFGERFFECSPYLWGYMTPITARAIG